jgi:hypothetical protein
MVKAIKWGEEKAAAVLSDPSRGGIGFEECVVAIAEGRILDVVQNPSINHPSQKMFILEINAYAYCVPFVESETEIFLKTVFPSRKFTALYLPEHKDEED